MLLKYFLLSILISCILCDTNYRLNTKVIPSEYEINITPYFNTTNDRAFTFDGKVTIKVSTAESGIKQIKLHSQDLTLSPKYITVQNRNGNILLNKINPLQFNNKYTFAYINLETPLLPKVEYKVTIVYKGPIRNDLNGFYRSSYIEKNITKWFGASQMGLTHARKVFPCFDEPQLKAKFTFIIDRPENYSPTLTNTKLRSSKVLNNGYIRETFFASPILSTYLVSFLISEFSNGGNINEGYREFGIWARSGAVYQAKYAFEFGKRALVAFENYFGIDYYSVDRNLHLFHVALPDFVWMAMEDWGLVKYKEEYLMYDPSESSPQNKVDVAQTIAHETAHMWFGNFVTCHWWSDGWLNEGFATYFQDYITSLIEPELGTADDQVTNTVYAAYNTDVLPNPAPLTNNDVNSPEEIATHFGTISYDKGGSIIRMIHHWIGDAAFRIALKEYLKVGQLSSGTPSMLYNAIDIGVKSAESLTHSDMAKLISPWITQSGYPILNVGFDKNTGNITLTQNRFYADNTYKLDEIYPIPITYTTQSAVNFDNTKPSFIMTENAHSFGNFSNAGWVVFNLQESGYYRVNYDNYLLSLIIDCLRGPNRTSIHRLNRAKIVNDLFALTLAKQVKMKKLLEMLEFLTDETEYSVWNAAIAGFGKLRDTMLGTAKDDQLVMFIRRLLEKVFKTLGFEEKTTDTIITRRNRMQITDFACKIGYDSCIKHAVTLYKGFRDNGTAIAPSLRQVAYCNGMKHGTIHDLIFISQHRDTTNIASEVQITGNALICTQY